MHTYRHISIAMLLFLLCYPSAQAAHGRLSEDILAPSVLFDYDSDALFSYVLVTQLARHDEKAAALEASWILNSEQQDIERIIKNADIYAQQFDSETDNNVQIWHDTLTRNLPLLTKALKQTKSMMSSGSIYLPRAYIVQRLWALRFDIANFKTLKNVDNGQELKLHNPKRHALLNNTQSLDTLHAQVILEFEKYTALRETA